MVVLVGQKKAVAIAVRNVRGEGVVEVERVAGIKSRSTPNKMRGL